MAVLRVPVDLTWPGTGGPGVNVFHLRTTEESGTPGNELILGDAMVVLNDLYDAVYGSYAAQGAVATFAGAAVDVHTQEIVEADPWTAVAPGTGGSTAPVLQVCATWRTSIAARRGRGRTFFGPLGNAAVETDGTIVPGALGGIRTACEAFVTASNGIAGGSFAVWGQETAGVPGINVARDITGVTIKDRFAVLRSRRD